jgi:SAM-dependent methyltransferase
MDILNSIYDYLPKELSKQYNAWKFVELLFSDNKFKNVLDLGCGKGLSYEKFMKLDSNIEWIGLDVKKSPEAKLRDNKNRNYCFFDGIKMPFKNNEFDLIFSNQVFEHVLYPRRLLKEVFRVLKKGGVFIGSVSQLEPYHSNSYWNYTPLGFQTILKEAKIDLIEIRPGIDVFTMMSLHALNGLWSGFDRFFHSSWGKDTKINKLIELIGKTKKKTPVEINAMKIKFCAQFSFLAKKDVNNKL